MTNLPIKGPSEEEYKAVLTNGGTLFFEVNASDIDKTIGFERSDKIKPHLESGFEVKPSPVMQAPANNAALYLYGGSWLHVVDQVYRRGGKIIYKRIQSGRYQARAELPPVDD